MFPLLLGLGGVDCAGRHKTRKKRLRPMDGLGSDQSGFSRSIRELCGAASSYIRARLELAGVEGKDALAQVGGFLLLGVFALTFLLAGYLLLCLALVFALAQWWHSEGSWIWIAAFLGCLHLLAAWLTLGLARGWLGKPMFEATLEEFRKDETWLKSTPEKPR